MFSQFLPADSPGLDRGQSAAATTFLGRTISHLLFFGVLPADSPEQTPDSPALLPWTVRAQSADYPGLCSLLDFEVFRRGLGSVAS